MAQATISFQPAAFMPVEERETVEELRRIVGQLQFNPALHDDLMQEALIHLWQMQERCPGQTRSWYRQNCRFHLQHHLAAGRSVDSLKRRNLQAQVFSHEDEPDNYWETLAGPDTFMTEVSARDILFALARGLSEREQLILHGLAEGLRVREIARQLDISHPTVIKSRRKIARIAKKLSIAPLP